MPGPGASNTRTPARPQIRSGPMFCISRRQCQPAIHSNTVPGGEEALPNDMLLDAGANLNRSRPESTSVESSEGNDLAPTRPPERGSEDDAVSVNLPRPRGTRRSPAGTRRIRRSPSHAKQYEAMLSRLPHDVRPCGSCEPVSFSRRVPVSARLSMQASNECGAGRNRPHVPGCHERVAGPPR